MPTYVFSDPRKLGLMLASPSHPRLFNVQLPCFRPMVARQTSVHVSHQRRASHCQFVSLFFSLFLFFPFLILPLIIRYNHVPFEDPSMSRSSVASLSSSTSSSQSQRSRSQLKWLIIINSLFHSYFVPPVVFTISKYPIKGFITRLRIDRKQCLTSVQKDFDGQVRHIVSLFLWFHPDLSVRDRKQSWW